MRPIPAKLREELAADHFMRSCCLSSSKCSGRVEWDHVWTYARRQINERFAIVPLCYYHHRGGGMNRPKTQWISLGRATEEELARYPRTDWKQLRKYLDKRFNVC